MSSKRFIQLVALLGITGALACAPVTEPPAQGLCVVDDAQLCSAVTLPLEFPDTTLLFEVHSGR